MYWLARFLFSRVQVCNGDKKNHIEFRCSKSLGSTKHGICRFIHCYLDKVGKTVCVPAGVREIRASNCPTNAAEWKASMCEFLSQSQSRTEKNHFFKAWVDARKFSHPPCFQLCLLHLSMSHFIYLFYITGKRPKEQDSKTQRCGDQ